MLNRIDVLHIDVLKTILLFRSQLPPFLSTTLLKMLILRILKHQNFYPMLSLHSLLAALLVLYYRISFKLISSSSYIL
jgi:hypothetical protein